MIHLAVIPGPSASLVLTLQAHWEENKAGSLGSSFPLSAPDPISVRTSAAITHQLPCPGLSWRPPSPVIWGEGGYYNSQNLKLRMNKSSVACHF